MGRYRFVGRLSNKILSRWCKMRRARSVVHAKDGIPMEIQKVAEPNLGDAYQYTRMRRSSC